GGASTFNATNGAITLDKANALTGAVALSNTGANNVTLNNNHATALILGTANVAGNLAVLAGGNITQAANTTVAVGGASSFNAANGAITLDQANTFTGAVSLINTGANNVTLTYNGALRLGTANVAAGNLVVTTTGNVTQAANTTLTVGGTATFNAT